MSHSSPYIVTTVADANYAEHTAVSFTSLLMNTTKPERIEFHVIETGWSSYQKQMLEQLGVHFKSRVVFHAIDTDKYKNLFQANHKYSYHITNAAYYRLSIPYLFTEAEKVLYIDCDTVIQEDITILWKIPLRHQVIAAAENFGGFYRNDDLFMPLEAKYFNSGVMMLQVPNWKKHQVTDQVVQFIQKHESRMLYHDQDGLNAVLYNHWFELHPKWNTMTDMFLKAVPDTRQGKKVMSAAEKPAVIHFTGPEKPWQPNTRHPLKHLYHEYAAQKDEIVVKPTSL